MTHRHGRAYTVGQDIQAERLKVLRGILDHIQPGNAISDEAVLEGGAKVINEIIDVRVNFSDSLLALFSDDFFFSLRNIVEYMESEEKHYEHCSEEERKNHIYLDVMQVKLFLGHAKYIAGVNHGK